MFQVTTVGSASAVVIYYQPTLSIVLLILAIPFFFANNILRKMRADIRRACLISYSPLVSLFNDTIDGVVMIRA